MQAAVMGVFQIPLKLKRRHAMILVEKSRPKRGDWRGLRHKNRLLGNTPLFQRPVGAGLHALKKDARMPPPQV